MRNPTIGELNTRIDILTPSYATDEEGNPVATWATLATVWAKKLIMRASTDGQAAQTITYLEQVYQIRYRADVTSDMRVVDDGHTLEITGVFDATGGRAFTEIHAIEVQT